MVTCGTASLCCCTQPTIGCSSRLSPPNPGNQRVEDAEFSECTSVLSALATAVQPLLGVVKELQQQAREVPARCASLLPAVPAVRAYIIPGQCGS